MCVCVCVCLVCLSVCVCVCLCVRVRVFECARACVLCSFLCALCSLCALCVNVCMRSYVCVREGERGWVDGGRASGITCTGEHHLIRSFPCSIKQVLVKGTFTL